MSTYLYLRCQAHDPALLSTDEVGQHLSDLEQITEWLTERQQILAAGQVPSGSGSSSYFGRAAVEFFRAHPHCPLDVVDEYGREHPLPHFTRTGDGPAVRHTALVVLPQVCGSRTTINGVLGATAGMGRLADPATVIVDFTGCAVISDSAVDHLIARTLTAGNTLLLILGTPPGPTLDQMREICRIRDIDPGLVRRI